MSSDPQPSSPPSSQTPAPAEQTESPGRPGPADPAARPGPDSAGQPGPAPAAQPGHGPADPGVQPGPAEQGGPPGWSAPAPVAQPGPAPAAQPAPAPGAQPARARPFPVRRAIGWAVVALIGVLSLLILFPDLLGFVSDSARLSVVYPFAQLIALRSGLVVGFGLMALVTGASALIRILRREGGRRTTAVALILLIAAVGHAWVLCSRGLGNDESAPAAIAPAGSISADPADWDGGLTTFSFNTHYSEAYKVELAVAIRRAAADVVVLPETSAEYGQAIADLLAQDGLRYTVFSAGDQKDDADPTTVLVSAVIGDYEQAQAPAGAGHGTVLLRPAGEAELNGHRRPTILGVHTHAPVPGSMEEWLASVEVVVGQCRGDGSDGAGRGPEPGLVVAGDFNATLDHAPMKDLGGCADAALETGIGGVSTWPTSSHTTLLGSPIDHVLADSATWSARSASVLALSGSDHRALVVELSAA